MIRLFRQHVSLVPLIYLSLFLLFGVLLLPASKDHEQYNLPEHVRGAMDTSEIGTDEG